MNKQKAKEIKSNVFISSETRDMKGRG